MKRTLKYVLWILLALALVGTFVFLYKKTQTPETLYQNDTVQRVASIEKSIILTGKIAPRDEILIVPQISGIVQKILKKPGDFVTAGEVIAQLSVVPEMMEISRANSRITLAKIEQAQAQERYKRDRALFEKGVLSKEEFQNSETLYKRAQNELDDAEDGLNIIQTGMSKRNSKGSSTWVRATISGVILDIPVRVGNSVIQANTFNAGTTIASIANMQDLIFTGKVDEIEVGKVTPGMEVKIIIGALNQLELSAVIEYVSPKAIPEGGANFYEVKAAVHLPNNSEIRAGMSANAEVVTERTLRPLSISESSLSFEDGKNYVYKLTSQGKKQEYVRTEVKTGISDGIRIQILSGLKEGEIVRGNEIINK